MASSQTSSSSRPQLKNYLTGLVGAASTMGAYQAHGAVTAVTVTSSVPAYQQGLGSYHFAATSDGTDFGNLFVMNQNSTFAIGGSFTPQGAIYTSGTLNPSNYGTPTLFSDGTVIGGGANGGSSLLGRGYFRKNSGTAFTSDLSYKNIGFKTSSGNYGWANVSWDDTHASGHLILDSVYVESVAGVPITIDTSIPGAVPEPSRALLALAGMAGVALRRRRRQVA